MSDKTWLTFMNSSCMTEAEIKSEFSEFGEVLECDGAIGGDGWVMVALGSQEKAKLAVSTLKERKSSKVGSSITLMDDMVSQEDGDEEDSKNPETVAKDVKSEKSPTKAASAKPQSVNVNTKIVESSSELLSKEMKEASVGGLSQFTLMNKKILEIVSQNNCLLLERVREVEEGCGKQLKEKDEQIKRLQNLLTSKDEHLKKLTGKLNASSDFEEKAKKFFGENEDFYKKKVEDVTKANKELTAKLGESEARRMENLLEEADTSKIREAVTGLASITEDIQSKTEQVWAVVQGMDGGQVSISADGDKTRDVMANSSTVGLLHNKVDKMIRLMVETSENQKKMNKVLQDLLKSGFVKNENSSTNGGEETHGENDKKRKRKERDRSRDRESEPVSKDKRSRSPDSSIDTQLNVGGGHQIDHEFEEMKWGLNMALIGDGHWKSFHMVEDIHNIVSRMEHKVNFRVMGKEGETLSRMYDDQRESLISALPTRCYKVGISVGTYDLKDNSLITLKEASMEEVRRRNEPKLVAKATILRDLVMKLNNQNKSVVVMIPPHGEDRIELHHHWEEIILSTLKDIKFPKIRILNMAQVMRSTMSEFRNNDDYLDMWLAGSPKPRRYLSQYGTRRMFYALRQTVTAKTPQAAGMGSWPEVGQNDRGQNQSVGGGSKSALIPNPAEYPCPRCTRHHPGTPETCKSIDKMCRRCQNVGHFQEVHDISDPHYRQLIVNTLGINLWGDWEMKPEHGQEHKPRGRMEEDRRSGRMDLDKLSEMERRMGLGSERGRDRGERGERGVTSNGPKRGDWY